VYEGGSSRPSCLDGTTATPIYIGSLVKPELREGLGVAWETANDAVLAEGKRVLIDDDTDSTAWYVSLGYVISTALSAVSGQGRVRVVSMETPERSAQLAQEWYLGALPVAYGLSEVTAREWGLFVSTLHRRHRR